MSDKKSIKCKHCSKLFKDLGSTSSCKYHMEHKHKIKFGESATPSKQSSVSDFFAKKESSPEVLPSLAALDHISFHTLATSKEIHKGWTAQGLFMPKSDQGIRTMVMSQGKKKKKEVCNQLSAMKAEGKKFSLSLDE